MAADGGDGRRSGLSVSRSSFSMGSGTSASRLPRKSLMAAMTPVDSGNEWVSPDRRSSRLSVLPVAGERHGSTMLAAVPEGGGAGGELHPALARMNNVIRRKSSMRKGSLVGRGGADFGELAALLDGVDVRLASAVGALRRKNAAALAASAAAVPTSQFQRSTSGRLPPGELLRLGSDREAAANSPHSPRAVLGTEAAEHPDRAFQRLHLSPHPSGGEAPEGGSGSSPDDANSGSQYQQGLTPRAASLLGGQPQWGATEGGRDTMGWVRDLVRFGESQRKATGVPPAVPSAAGATPAATPPRTAGSSADDAMAAAAAATAAAAGAGTPDTIGMLSATSAARQGRAGRGEVAALVARLQDMMAHVVRQVNPAAAAAGTAAAAAAEGSGTEGGTAPTSGTAPSKSPAELADAALFVYGAAFGELQKQVAAECSDRGELLGALWSHCFNLVR